MRALAIACAALGIMWAVALSWPADAPEGHGTRFSQEPCDRPVLTTRQAVWEERFGGGYPKAYVDYAAWWVRLD